MMELPIDFIDRMKALLGDEWESFWQCFLGRHHQSLRLNPLKKNVTASRYPEILNTLGIDGQKEVKWAEDAFYYEEKEESCQPGKHPYHEMGLYYIQEPSAMSAAALLAPKPGERVLDLCGAPGGKSTQLASCMQQQGILVANEIHPSRAKILSQNVERMGISNALVTNEDSGSLAHVFGGFFHRILVDAPCSGEGMFRKNPQAVSEWSMEHVKMCAKRQYEILENAARMLMPGGTLVYSTCTFSPEENEQVIARFLREHMEFSVVPAKEKPIAASCFSPGRSEWADGTEELKECFRLWPHRLEGEGHFAAVLKKAGTLKTVVETKEVSKKVRGKKNSPKDQLDKDQKKSLELFVEETLEPSVGDWLIRQGTLTLFGDQLYRLPADPPDLTGIRVLRPGLHLGTFKKNRFEPSHALALFLGRDQVKDPVELHRIPDQELKAAPEVSAYFRGESIGMEAKKGWKLMCVDGFSAGWGKASGNNIKNHYPKGLRKG